jgi:hypothetical protein
MIFKNAVQNERDGYKNGCDEDENESDGGENGCDEDESESNEGENVSDDLYNVKNVTTQPSPPTPLPHGGRGVGVRAACVVRIFFP